MAKDRKIKVEVFRYDPDVGKEPYFDVYEIPFCEKMSVTNVLEYIYEEVDSSLGFFASCKRGNCGRCVVKKDGKNCLACITEVEGDVKIEPAKGKRVIRDLRVDDI